MPNELNEYDAGLDWLTVTTTEGAQTQGLIELVHELEQNHIDPEELSKDWKGLGYAGRAYSQLKFGRRAGDEAIMILSGKLAYDFGFTYKVDHTRVTRADFAVTVALDEPDPDIAHRTYTKYKNLQKESESGRMYTYISSPTGDTLNVGKRTHQKYMRFYDKSSWFNNRPLGSYWRYEVELKKLAAKRAMEMFNETEERHRFVAEQVWSAFEKRGVEPLFHIGNKPTSLEIKQKVTTADSKIAWLSRCVAPVVTQLINLGYEEEVLRSLKLSGVYRD